MTNLDNQKVVSKIRFLEAQLVSLDHYLPETYEYLMQELDLQKRILAELEVNYAFASIDHETDSPTDTAPGTPEK
jgi:hypothetical protein